MPTGRVICASKLAIYYARNAALALEREGFVASRSYYSRVSFLLRCPADQAPTTPFISCAQDDALLSQQAVCLLVRNAARH